MKFVGKNLCLCSFVVRMVVAVVAVAVAAAVVVVMVAVMNIAEKNSSAVAVVAKEMIWLVLFAEQVQQNPVDPLYT